MYQFTALAIAMFPVFVFLTSPSRAQSNHSHTRVSISKNISTQISQAVAKSYQASVLMWEIDAESGARMSAQFSGVVVSREGVILSAAHVVMPGKTYKVMFPDGRECVAKGLGRITIPPTFMLPDAAMLKIADKGEWPFAEMGWSSSLTVNTLCISIAYPESLEQRKPTVRFGHITLLKNQYGFLQSSCIMEPGDSGGPLFDLLGRVIGIHSGVEIPEDVNYEVPVDTYRKYWQALNKPVNYTELPADTNSISADPLLAQIKIIPTAKDVQGKLNSKRLQLPLSYVKIKSVIDGKEQQILGTVLSTDGFTVKPGLLNENVLVSKSSMVGDAPVVMLPGGKTIQVNVIARSRMYDLVVLQFNQTNMKGIKLDHLQSDTISFGSLGALLISPKPDSPARVGVLGSMLLNLPKITSYGYIGATTGIKDDKLVFTYLQPNGAAQIGGLQTGDTIKTVDGRVVEDPLDFLKALQKYSAGDTTSINIMRGGGKYTKSVVLKYPPQKVINHPAELFTGGKSIRRDGFDKVFVHDLAIKANECGGPIFDVNGRFVGINIARLSRTSTVSIPASSIKLFLTNSFKGK